MGAVFQGGRLAPGEGAASRGAGVNASGSPPFTVVSSGPPGAQPYLGARCVGVRSGDVMHDRVSWGAAAHSMGAGRAGPGSRSIAEPAAGSSVRGRGGGGAWSGGGGECLVAELAQGVVAAAGELAGHRQGG